MNGKKRAGEPARFRLELSVLLVVGRVRLAGALRIALIIAACLVVSRVALLSDNSGSGSMTLRSRSPSRVLYDRFVNLVRCSTRLWRLK